jgi:thiol-disulfide isomerase/thioredoxin
MQIGDRAEPFSLPATDGTEHGPDGITVVVFTCNHCPYALAWHDRLTRVAQDYDVTFLAVNPNNAETHPRDSFDAMRKRVEADGGWPHPYLRDESQDVARAFGARTTPDVFVLDAGGVLRYRGAPDADYRDESQGAAWLREALDSVLAGERPERPETEPVGCSVKWR